MFHSVGIITEDRAEITTPLPINENQSPVLFTLKEGTKYCLKLTFSVRHNIVSGLTYCNTVWKAGHQGNSLFHSTIKMLIWIYVNQVSFWISPLLKKLGYSILLGTHLVKMSLGNLIYLAS